MDPQGMPEILEDRLVTKKQAAERLAVSTRTIDRLVALGQLEKVFVGPSPRLRKSDIDRIVDQGLGAPNP
jgi:excisionase family DNA binding protein